MTDHDLLLDDDSLIRFPARERRGVFLGLGLAQVVLASSAIGVTAIFFTAGAPLPVSGVVFVLALFVVAVALVSFRGESGLLLLGRLVRYLRRRASGQTGYRRNVWADNLRTHRPAGRAKPGTPTPQVVSGMALPGSLGDVATVQIPFKGAFIHNAKTGLVSVTCTVRSAAWEMRDSSDRQAAYDGLVDWFSSLQSITGLAEATMRIRVDKASTTELTDYIEARDAAAIGRRSFEISASLEAEYSTLIASGAKRAMAFTNYITLTFRISGMSRLVKDSGGGLAGIGAVLEDRIEQLKKACEHARVEFGDWLRASALDQHLAACLDPVSAARARAKENAASRATRLSSPLMAVEEFFDHIRVDGSLHQTYWIAEWPRTATGTGFLSPLLYTGDCARTVTLQMRPVPIEKSLTQVNRAQASLEAADAIRLKLRVTPTKRQEREAQDLDDREEQIVDGFGDLRVRGFVTVSAEDAEALARGRSDLEQAQHPARIVLASLWGQQAAAFVTSVLPVPTHIK